MAHGMHALARARVSIRARIVCLHSNMLPRSYTFTPSHFNVKQNAGISLLRSWAGGGYSLKLTLWLACVHNTHRG